MAESKEEIKINLGHLASALRKLRNLRLMSSDYITVLTLLKYNKPASISSKKFDSILIKAIIEEFSGIDRDVLLMALGLLQGYEREIKIGTRRENYLKNSDYITDFYYDNRGAYEKVDSGQQKKYKNSLIDAEKNRINELADFLANKIKKKEFDEFIKDLKDYYDSDTDNSILPEPEYIKKQKKTLKLSQNSNTENDNIQSNKDDVWQNRNEPRDFDARDAKRHKRRKKRKVNMSVKSESTAVAAAGSYVSVHIVNVVGEPKKSNNAALIQGIGEKIQKIFLLGSEGLVEQPPDSSDKDKTRKRNKRVSKRNILGVILVLVVLLIIVIVIFQPSQSTPVMSDYPLQSEQEWLKLNMENMNREMGGNAVNGVKATIEYSITDPDTGQEYTYTKALSLEQNTAELEEPIDENID